MSHKKVECRAKLGSNDLKLERRVTVQCVLSCSDPCRFDPRSSVTDAQSKSGVRWRLSFGRDGFGRAQRGRRDVRFQSVANLSATAEIGRIAAAS